MKLSTRVRYGVRALVDLAISQVEDSPVLLDRIAQRQGISRKYLDAIFARLKASGMVHSTRGAGGGFVLAKKPNEISMGEVYKALEGPLDLVDCRTGDPQCGRQASCPSYEVWHGLATVMEKYLDSVTLGNLVEKDRTLRQKDSTMFFI